MQRSAPPRVSGGGVSTPEPVTVVSDEGWRVTYVSPGITDLLGWSPEAFAADYRQLFHPDDAAVIARLGDELGHRPGGSRTAQARLRAADGSWHWIEITAVNLLEAPGQEGIVSLLRPASAEGAGPAGGGSRFTDRRIHKLVEGGSDVICVLDDDGRVAWVSGPVARLLGWPSDTLLGIEAEELIHPDDLTAARGVFRTVLENPELLRGEHAMRLRQADGGWRWVGVAARDQRDDPDVAGVLLNLRDVHDREEAARSADQLGQVLESTTDLVALFDHDDRLVFLNRAAREFLSVPDDGLEGFRPGTWLPARSRYRWIHEIAPTLEAHGTWSGELAVTDRSGDEVPLSVVLARHRGGDQPAVLSVIARDISDRKALEARLAHDATHDPLTGLPNRTLLLDRLRVATARSRRTARTTAVLFLDLDNFKVVNDSLGHSMGDRLLVTLAERLAATVRPGDTVARFGGDEFVVLAEDLRERDDALHLAERILHAAAQPVIIGDNEVYVSASIGVAFADTIERDADDLLRDADAAMYQAKARGRSRIEVFDLSMHTRVIDRLSLENDLRRAIGRRELRVYFQPEIGLQSGRVVGVEALVRWEHPERGLLDPHEFLSVAEDSRLIVPIGEWVLLQSCRAMQRVQQVTGVESLDLSVNLSAHQLTHTGLVEDLAASLADIGFDPGRLNLEITESVLMEDVDIGVDTLGRLRELGIRIAIDDFGTGYSSLNRLRSLPVDGLKIDRSFVAGVGADPNDTAIVDAMVHLGHVLRLSVVAEGVESLDQLDVLRRMGCDRAQGYAIGKPVPEADLLELLSGPDAP